MIIPDRVKWVSEQSGFPLWLACVGANNICELIRVAGFRVSAEGQCITVFVPQRMFARLMPFIKSNVRMNLLMASLNDFESYQIKGFYESHDVATKPQLDFFKPIVSKTIEQVNTYGLAGPDIMGYLLEEPSIAVTIRCDELYDQTPKPGTGGKM